MWIYYIIIAVNLHLSVSFCGHLQGVVLRNIYYKGNQVMAHNPLSLSPDWRWLQYSAACRHKIIILLGRGQLKRDSTRAETRFRLSAKRTSPFKSAGASFQSTTGSRSVRISGSNAGYTMFRGSVKGTGYPLHSPVSPSIALPCGTVCRHISTGVYVTNWQPFHMHDI